MISLPQSDCCFNQKNKLIRKQLITGDSNNFLFEIFTADEEWNGFDGFVCPDGTRLGKSKICDGMRDCYDCSDESNCTQGKQKFFYCYHAGESLNCLNNLLHRWHKGYSV